MEKKKMSLILERTREAYESLFYEYCKLQDAFLQVCPKTKFEFYTFGKKRARKIKYWQEKYYLLVKEYLDLLQKKELDEDCKKEIKKILKKIKIVLPLTKSL